MVAVSYHESADEVQALELARNRALGGIPTEDRGIRSGRPCYAVAEDNSGRVVFPLALAGRSVRAAGDREGNAWRPLVSAYASADSLSIALAKGLATRASHVLLDRVPDHDGTARQLERAFARAGWIVELSPGAPATDALSSHQRIECWRARDPRNWPALAVRRLRALVSGRPRG